MNDFMDKMKNDTKFSAAVKLGFCSLFVVFAFIYILVVNADISKYADKYRQLLEAEEKGDNYIIELPEEYNYIYRLNYNDKTTLYNGTVESNIININVVDSEENEKSYTFLNNNYYLKDGDNLTKVSEEDIYNIIAYKYFDINTINEYIDYLQQVDELNIVYLKDILEEYDGEDYITFKFADNSVTIDYTNLLKQVYENLDNCTLYFEYSGKE